MRVYRAETKGGEGMYYSGKFGQAVGTTSACIRHPMPEDDWRLQASLHKKMPQIDYKEDRFKFGFQSKSQFKRWVYKKKWRAKLGELGVTLNVYDVDTKFCMLGNNQCTFWKGKAKLVEKINLSNFDDRG